MQTGAGAQNALPPPSLVELDTHQVRRALACEFGRLKITVTTATGASNAKVFTVKR